MIMQGDVYWLDLDSPDGSEPGYQRPCVVIQNNKYNRTRLQTVLVCALSTNLRLAHAPGNVLLQAGEGNLPQSSVVLVTQVITEDRRELIDYIGRLPMWRVRQIIRGVHQVIELSDDDEELE